MFIERFRDNKCVQFIFIMHTENWNRIENRKYMYVQTGLKALNVASDVNLNKLIKINDLFLNLGR